MAKAKSEIEPSAAEVAQDTADPADFCPGFLFDTSATWVLFVRRLLVPAYYRSGGDSESSCEAGTCGCYAQTSDDGSEKKKKKKKKKKAFWSC